ncbi:MAG TPA: VPDSG-CTERM sorting domain-containing protein [Terrimicrobiaceae bacterium]
MKSVFSNSGPLLALAVGLLGGALFCQQAQAVPITVYEEIKDLRTGGTSTNPSDVQLQRNRLNPDGTITTVTDDRGNGVLGYVDANGIPGTQTTVRTENSVSDGFGFNSSATVTFVHRIDWLSGFGGFIGGTLEIWSQSVNHETGGPNDPVLIELDSISLGYLGLGTSTATFALNGINVSTYLADGFLDVKIIPRGAGNSDNGENLAINASKLTLTYDPDATAAQGVPDGGTTAVLLGGSLVAICVARRKFATI